MEEKDALPTVKIVLCEDEKEYCNNISSVEYSKSCFFINFSDSHTLIDDHIIFQKLQNSHLVLVLSGFFDEKSVGWFKDWMEKNQSAIIWDRLKVVVVSSRRTLYLLQEDYRESFIPIIDDVYRDDGLEEVEIPLLTNAEIEEEIGRDQLNKDSYMRYMKSIPGLSEVLAHRHFLNIYLEKLPRWIEILKVKGLDIKEGEEVKSGCVIAICRALLNAWYESMAKEELGQSEQSAERALHYKELSEEIAWAMSEFGGSLSREQMQDCIEQAKDEDLIKRCLRGVPVKLKEVKANKYEFRIQAALLMNFLVNERRIRIKKGPELRLFKGPLKLLRDKEYQDEDEWLNDDLNKVELPKDELESFAERLRSETKEAEELRKKLLGWVYRTRKGKEYSMGGRNAITILNYSRLSFSGWDLSGTQTPNSDFSEGAFDYAKFRNSNISGSRIDGSFRFADFEGANIEGVQHGVYEREFDSSLRCFDQDLRNNKIVLALQTQNGFWITLQDLLDDKTICKFTILRMKTSILAINIINGFPEDIESMLKVATKLDIQMVVDDDLSTGAVCLCYEDAYILFVIQDLALVKYDLRLETYSILHKGQIRCLVKAGASNLFVFNDANNLILLTIANKRSECKFENFTPLHRNLITHLAFDSNKSSIAAVSQKDKSVSVWSLKEKCVIEELEMGVKRPNNEKESLRPWVSSFDPTGSKIAVSFGECISLWDTESFTYIGTFYKQINAARKLIWGSTGAVLFYADWYGNFYSIAVENSGFGKNQKLLLNLGESVLQIAQIPCLSGVFFSMISLDNRLRLINFDFLEKRRIEGPQSLVVDLIVVDNSYYVAHFSGEICKYNLNIGALEQIYKNFTGFAIKKLIATNDGEILVCFFGNDEIVFRNLHDSKEKLRISYKQPRDFRLCGYKIAFNPFRMMMGYCQGEVHYISQLSSKLLHTHPQHAHSFSFSENGKFLASGSGTENGEVVIFNIENESLYFRFNIMGKIYDGCCEFSKDNRYLAVTCTAKKLYVFDVLNKAIKCIDIEAWWGGGFVESIAIYSSTELVIAIGFSESILIWNISTNKQVNFNGHLSQVHFIKFINASTLLAIDRTGARKLWKIEVTKGGAMRVLLRWGYNQLFSSMDLGDDTKAKINSEQMKMISASLPFFSKDNLGKNQGQWEAQTYQNK